MLYGFSHMPTAFWRHIGECNQVCQDCAFLPVLSSSKSAAAGDGNSNEFLQ
jgi:hypothetical protein